LGITKKWLPFVGQECGYFCWLNYAILQEITTAQKRFTSKIHKNLSFVFPTFSVFKVVYHEYPFAHSVMSVML